MKGVCALLLVTLFSCAAHGATVTFNYSPDLNGTFEWNDGSIWSTGTLPQAGDDVVIIGSNVSYHFSPLKVIDMGTVPINLHSFYFHAYDIQLFLGTSFTVANITEFGTADITGYGNASMLVTEYADFVIQSPFRTSTVLSNGPVVFTPNIDLNVYGGYFEYVVLQGGTIHGSPLILNGVLREPDNVNLTIINSAVTLYGTLVLESSNIQFTEGANIAMLSNSTIIVQQDLYDAELQSPWGIVNNPGGTVIFNANQGATKQIGIYIQNWADMHINTTITDPSQPKGVTLDFTAPLWQLFNGTLYLTIYSDSDFDKILYFPRELPEGLAPPCTFTGFLDYKFDYTPSPNTLIPVITSVPGCVSAYNLTTTGLPSDLTAQLLYDFPSEDGSNSVIHKLRICSVTDPDCSGSSTCSVSVAAVARGDFWTDQFGRLNQVYDIHVTNTGQRDVIAASVELELAAQPAGMWNLANTSDDVYAVPFWNPLLPNATVSYSGLIAVGGITVTLASVTCA